MVCQKKNIEINMTHVGRKVIKPQKEKNKRNQTICLDR